MDVARLTWQLVCLVALILAAYVAIVLTGHTVGDFLTLVTTIIAVLGLGAHQAVRLSQQDQVLDKISEQTNGVLDQRIRDGVKAGLAEVIPAVEHAVEAPPVPQPSKSKRKSKP